MEVMGNDLSRGLFPVKEVKLLNSLRWALLLAMSLANRFKDLYRGQLFNLWSSSAFFPLKISLLEMLIAFGDSKTFTEGNFSTSGPPLFSSKFHFLRCSLIPPLPSFTGSTIFTSSHCKQAMLGFVSTSLAHSC